MKKNNENINVAVFLNNHIKYFTAYTLKFREKSHFDLNSDTKKCWNIKSIKIHFIYNIICIYYFLILFSICLNWFLDVIRFLFSLSSYYLHVCNAYQHWHITGTFEDAKPSDHLIQNKIHFVSRFLSSRLKTFFCNIIEDHTAISIYKLLVTMRNTSEAVNMLAQREK